MYDHHGEPSMTKRGKGRGGETGMEDVEGGNGMEDI